MRHLYVRFPASPILHANAQDAFSGAGYRFRAQWHAWRTHRLRSARLKRANKLFERGEWFGAYANYDFAVIGRQDLSDAYAHVMRAVCMQQEGHLEQAESDFKDADARFPDLALILRLGCLSADAPELPNGVPGTWPTNEEGVYEIVRERGFPGPPGHAPDRP